MLLFLDSQQQYINGELEEINVDIFGSCTSILNNDKAAVVIKHKRDFFKPNGEDDQVLFRDLIGN